MSWFFTTATIESRLQALVPSIGRFFTTLPLRQSFLIEDEKMKISARRHVPMSFNDIRKILNRAQVLAVVDGLKLITLYVGIFENSTVQDFNQGH